MAKGATIRVGQCQGEGDPALCSALGTPCCNSRQDLEPPGTAGVSLPWPGWAGSSLPMGIPWDSIPRAFPWPNAEPGWAQPRQRLKGAPGVRDLCPSSAEGTAGRWGHHCSPLTPCTLSSLEMISVSICSPERSFTLSSINNSAAGTYFYALSPLTHIFLQRECFSCRLYFSLLCTCAELYQEQA